MSRPFRHDGRTTSERGYGQDHRRARRERAALHHPLDPCVRCGHPLGPMGSWLHLDHTADRTGWLGFAHGSSPCPICGVRCNLSAGVRAGNFKRGQQEQSHRDVYRAPRSWDTDEADLDDPDPDAPTAQP